MSSIRDVARAAGVSTATVSHVINNTRYVSAEVRARVLAAVERCGYIPNANARSLASGRSRTLGLVVSDISNPFFPELVKAIETAGFEHGYDIVLSNTNYDPARTSQYVRRFIERKAAGVVLMTSELDRSLIAELARREVSVVFLDLGEPGPHMSNLKLDYSTGIDEAIRHLVSLGHRRIAFIGGPPRLPSAALRLAAFRASLSRYLPDAAELIYEGDFKLEGGARAAAEMLAAAERPTAVLAANDMTALGAMNEFRSAGLAIPGDVSVVGFDDIAFASLCEPKLTTVCVPRETLGRRAVEALIATLSHPEQRGEEVSIETHLVIRASTGVARASRVGDAAATKVRGARPTFEPV
jgi:DNA-binding LacI/PurR family transcriptional regulator